MEIKSFDYLRQLAPIKPAIVKSIEDTLSSGKIILGNQVQSFENQFSKYIGQKFGIGVNSGTDAIKIALRSLGIGPGDEVITVSNTAVPTISAVREVGGTPVFVDVKPDYTINEALITKLLLSIPR